VAPRERPLDPALLSAAASVDCAKARDIASFEPGPSSRWTIIARQSARSLQGRRSSRRASSSRRAIASAASTCPAGNERSTASASSAATKRWPRSAPRISSITSSGRCERLATVSFFTTPPSR